MTIKPSTHHVPHTLYRAYAANGVLLYVGCTHQVGKRMAEHTGTDWLRITARITLEGFPDRASGRAAERAAIHDERPIYNSLGNTTLRPQRKPIRFEQHRPQVRAA